MFILPLVFGIVEASTNELRIKKHNGDSITLRIVRAQVQLTAQSRLSSRWRFGF
jgi:hypothetical protein